MARISEEFKFTVNLGQGKKNPVLILKQPTAADIHGFLSSRVVRKGREIIDQTVKAKSDLVDKLLIGCGQVEISVKGKWVTLTPKMTDWKSKIPVNWKTSVGNHFEEREVFTEADEKK